MSGKNTINTYCRIAPLVTPNRKFQPPISRRRPIGDEQKLLEYQINLVGGKRNRESIQMKKSALTNHIRFAFNNIFEKDDSQDKVFTAVSKPVIENVLDGYNGTVLAYGQTATGKTYTIMGEGYENQGAETRGLIPRSLELIWEKLESSGQPFRVMISCMEVYREKGYDLLNVKTHIIKKNTFVKKGEVICRMDRDDVRLQNLSVRQVMSFEEAMNTFLEGSRNRAVSETYANVSSSRSHCIFTIYIERKYDTGVTKAKLSFVDLAGSERIGKGRLKNQALVEEAKDINRSLLFLRDVIEATVSSSKSKPKIFRNTMLTKILRDSFTGNCVTSLVATISSEERNIDETISTCQFAQSVSRIKMKPVLNKTEDLKLVNKKLQYENHRLNERINELEVEDPELTNEWKSDLKQLVHVFYHDDNPEARLEVEGLKEHLDFCFKELKILGKNDQS